MKTYRLQSAIQGYGTDSHGFQNLDNFSSTPFDPANTDYANFKREINEGTAQLQDADGNLMTAEQARDFVKELP